MAYNFQHIQTMKRDPFQKSGFPENPTAYTFLIKVPRKTQF